MHSINLPMSWIREFFRSPKESVFGILENIYDDDNIKYVRTALKRAFNNMLISLNDDDRFCEAFEIEKVQVVTSVPIVQSIFKALILVEKIMKPVA